MSPADFIKEAFHAEMTVSDDGMSVEYSLKGKKLQVAAGIRAAVLDESIKFMPLCLDMEGTLYVPIGKIAEYLLGMNTLNQSGATYITNSQGILTYDLAYYIRMILGTTDCTEPKDWVAIDKKIRKDLESRI